MNVHVSTAALDDAQPLTLEPQVIDASAAQATRRIAPLWPLRSFVAVNPFLGLADRTAPGAARLLAEAGGARLTMPLAFYAKALGEGTITDADLAAAIAEYPEAHALPPSVPEYKVALARSRDVEPPVLPSIADTATALTGKAWADFVNDRISHWASLALDEGQSQWRIAGSQPSLFAAWKAEAAIDMTPDIMGLARFRAVIRALPDDAAGAMRLIVSKLGLAADDLTAYFHRLLFSLSGWASYLRYLGWDKELAGETDGRLKELLAVRLAWDHGLLASLGDDRLAAAWRRDFISVRSGANHAAAEAAMHLKLAAHMAYEKARQRELLSVLPAPAAGTHTPRVQAVFCIDVRSEVFRRALEATSPEIETMGFAGFFGASIAHASLDDPAPRAQVPVLLKPAFTVHDAAADHPAATERLKSQAALKIKTGKAWKQFASQAVSCFGFVETAGPGFGLSLLSRAAGLASKPTDSHAELAPSLAGVPAEAQLGMAENALRGMSLTQGFAPLVLLVGHGSSSTNNLHASGLDCGACGGHTGEVNARVMAAILNDPQVRDGLAARGIHIPDTTVFLGALHNTTTDEVTVFDGGKLSGTAATDLAWITGCLERAGKAARAERSARLPGAGDPASRAHDWSQVRPEWGLAGCAAFIAAPRNLTKHADFKGRAFLHSYDWRADEGFKVLELIMTAPMVVASWISLQYFGSTVDNRNFGCGNKVLHNAVGTFGVLEGNSGPLRSGLPLQSVHDGKTFVHDPVRLSVMIAAPVEAMNQVIAKHPHVRDLLDNGWLHLLAMDDEGKVSARYAGHQRWLTVESPAALVA